MVRRIGSIVGGGSAANPPLSLSPPYNSKAGELPSSSSRVPKKSRSLPVRASFSFQPPLSSKADAVSLKRPFPSPIFATGEISTLLTSAKPSEVRAAAKAGRAASRAERERQQRMLQSQQEAQMKMNKIRAEIDAIKAKESCRKLGSGISEHDKTEYTFMSQSESSIESREKEVLPATSDLDSSIDDILASMEHENTDEMQLKKMGRKLLEEMEASFAKLGVTQGDFSNSSHHVSLRRHALKNDEIDPSQVNLHGMVQTRKIHIAPDVFRHHKPSNLVPEMRRRASRHDLLFDDEHIYIPSSTLPPMSTHSPVAGSDFAGDKAKTKTLAPCQDLGSHIEHMTGRVLQPQETQTEPSPPPKYSTSRVSEPTSPTLFRCSMTTSHVSPKRDERTLAKMEEERQKAEAQRKKLEEAKKYFQEGHDLCWKMQDSAGALGGYRKALFIRESLLGKYHDETGRTYYWIGRSLLKLREHDEALVAFSRAYRIFDRVLNTNHKYRKWSETAIAGVFKEMDDNGRFFDSYQRNLEASIVHERAGDLHRKKGLSEEAISEYLAAISNIEEYHPDAADLHCKIAMIFRRQGEFEKALEENRLALQIYELSLGAEHPETVKTLNQTLEKKRLSQVSLALMEKLNFGK